MMCTKYVQRPVFVVLNAPTKITTQLANLREVLCEFLPHRTLYHSDVHQPMPQWLCADGGGFVVGPGQLRAT
jgi:hypothetical protein